MPDIDVASIPGSVVELSTHNVPQSERFSWWSEMVSREVMQLTTRSEHAPCFHGRAEKAMMSQSGVTGFRFSPISARRSAVQIRRHDPEEYFLLLVRVGAIRLEQNRGVACLDAGGMALFSTSHPLACDFLGHGGEVGVTLMQLPRAALPLKGGRADRLLAEPLRPDAGATVLLGAYLAGLLDAVRASTPAETARLGAIGLDLATTALAGRLGTQDSVPPETRRVVLMARIKAFIDQHIDDPSLRPVTIAAHHHISVRTLHMLFRDEPETVAVRIRRRRLERCHVDLVDPELRHFTIAEIAARRGFRDASDFSRVFRSAYGVAPSEIRAGALQARDSRSG
jgi:AraC-like DNA-binding protein